MDSREPESEQPRKPYSKPELIQVALRPEEAVLGFCKSSGAAGPTHRSMCMLCRGNGS
jgi:hypothetical protein